jgi:hypothetical protein
MSGIDGVSSTDPRIQLELGTTVFDDLELDLLTGGTGHDWFFD